MPAEIPSDQSSAIAVYNYIINCTGTEQLIANCGFSHKEFDTDLDNICHAIDAGLLCFTTIPTCRRTFYT